MKKLTKLLTLAMAMILALALMASCTTADPEPTQAPSATPAATPSEEPSAEPLPEPGNPILPLTDEPVTFKWFRPIAQENMSKYGGFDENHGYVELAKRTGVTIEFVSPVFGTHAEQFNLMITSGDYTDLISGDYTGGLDKAIEDEVYLRINDLVEKYAPNYQQWRNNNPGMKRDSITDNGNMAGIYSLAKLDGKPRPWGGLYIRQDWLDDLGMPTPVTYDDYYVTLKAFKDEKGASSPLFMEKTGVFTAGDFISGFDLVGSIYQVDGVVKFGPVENGYKEYLMLMNQWFNEGLFAKDFMTNQSMFYMPDTSFTTTGKSGVFWNVYMSDMLTMMSGNPDYKLSAVLQPVRNVGDKLHFMGPAGAGDTAQFSVAITTACSDPVLAVRWADYQFSPEGYLLTTYGIEGTSYEMVDGQPKFLDVIEDVPYADAIGKYVMGAGSPCVWDFDAEYSMLSETQLRETDVWAQAGRDYGMPAISMTVDEGARSSVLLNEINTYVAEMTLKFIIGDESFDNYDQYLNQVKQMGSDEVIQINQAALDRYNAR